MNRFQRFIRYTLRRKYWITQESPISDEIHVYPNRDLRRHEALDCWCGTADELYSGSWLRTHHSLDGREHRERA